MGHFKFLKTKTNGGGGVGMKTKFKPNMFCHSLQKNLGIEDVQCSDYCHLLSKFPSKSQHPSQCFITRCYDAVYTKVKVDELKSKWDDFTHNFLIRSVIRKVITMT